MLTVHLKREVMARYGLNVLRTTERLRAVLAEFGLEPDDLIAEYGPHRLVPPSLRAPGDEVDPTQPEPQPYPFVRAEQERRLQAIWWLFWR